MAREWETLLAEGTFSSRAEVARGLGVSRARVTQVLGLLNLPAEALDVLAEMGDPLPSGAITEHRLRQLAQLPTSEQVQWVRSLASAPSLSPYLAKPGEEKGMATR